MTVKRIFISAASMLAAVVSQAQAADRVSANLVGTWCETTEVQSEADGWMFFKRGKCADSEDTALTLKLNGDYVMSNFAHEMVCRADQKSFFKGWADYTCTVRGKVAGYPSSTTKHGQKFTFDGRILGRSNIDVKAREFVPGTSDADCTVADPTDTPLNVRKTPNGPILGALHNETPVFVMKIVSVNDKKWALVFPENGDARLGRGQGWVYFNYLDCERSMYR
jgi:hypothetical protein